MGRREEEEEKRVIHSRNSTESQHAAVTSLRRAEREEKSEKSKRTAEVRNQWWLIEHNWKWPASQRKKKSRSRCERLSQLRHLQSRTLLLRCKSILNFTFLIRARTFDRWEKPFKWRYLDIFGFFLSLTRFNFGWFKSHPNRKKKSIIQYQRLAVVRCRNWKLRWEICFNFDIYELFGWEKVKMSMKMKTFKISAN